MSTRINLLPWRDIKRREQDRRIVTMAMFAALSMVGLVMAGYFYWNGAIDFQKQRNSYLVKQIDNVKKEIEEIALIREKKESLIARMNIIQQLQLDRTQIVHMFDDLVRKMPKGVYFTQFKKDKKTLTISGFAHSNARVSKLMTNIESSEWFESADLDVINITERGANKVSKFDVRVTETGLKERQSQEKVGSSKLKKRARKS